MYAQLVLMQRQIRVALDVRVADAALLLRIGARQSRRLLRPAAVVDELDQIIPTVHRLIGNKS